MESLFLSPSLLTVPKPTCARCKQPVERMEVSRDACTMRDVFHIECHGRREKFEVNAEFLAAPGRLGMVEVFGDEPAALPSTQLAVTGAAGSERGTSSDG